MTKEGKVAAILVCSAVAVAVGVVVTQRGNEDLACSLSGPAASAAVAAVSKGRGAEQIAGATIAGVLVPMACKPVIKSLIEAPNERVTLNIETPTGQTVSNTLAGTEFLDRPPAPSQSTPGIPPGTTVAQMINCGGWDSRVLWDMCLSGLLPPKLTPYAEKLVR